MKNPGITPLFYYYCTELTDLSMAVLVMPLSSISAMTNTWITKELGCKLNYLCSNVLGAISLFTTMFLAINRYIRVVRPALYANIFSKKRSVAMAVCVLIAAILSVTLVVLITGNKYQTFTIQPASCFQFLADNIQPKLYDALALVYITIPSVVVIVCYINIYRFVRNHNASAPELSQGSNVAYGVEEARVTKILTVVVVGFYLCWLPVLCSKFLGMLNVIVETAFNYFNFYFTFPVFASSVINPVVYATLSRPFRNEFVKILHFKN